MIPQNAKIFVWSEPVDGRSGKGTLGGIVSSEMRESVFNGDVYVFISVTQRVMKCLFHDGTGFVLVTKVLDPGTVYPLLQAKDGRIPLKLEQFLAIFHGDDPFSGRRSVWSRGDILQVEGGTA